MNRYLFLFLPLVLLGCTAQPPDSRNGTGPGTPHLSKEFRSSTPAYAYPDWEAEITGASVVIPEDMFTLHAVPEGTPSIPEGSLPLLQALEQALALNQEGKDVRIRLASGEYRSHVFVRKDRGVPASDALLVIEGPEDRSAVITSSSNWSGETHWTASTERPEVLVATWDKDWGDMDITHPEGRQGPSAPWLKLRATDDVQLHLTWKAARDVPVPQAYRLYRKALRRDRSKRYQGKDEKTESNWDVVYEGPNTTFTDTELVKSKTWDTTQYSYRVVGLTEEGESEGSNVVKAAPGDFSNAARPGQLGRRRELVFVEDVRMQQVLTPEELVPGSYLVEDGYPGDPSDGRLHLMLPEGTELGSCRIDVSTKQYGNWIGSPQWLFEQKNHLALRNLTIQHHPGHYHSASAMVIRDCQNVLIENCTFQWNNSSGITVLRTQDLTLRNLVGSDNGGCGLMWTAGGNILAENLETHRNNWRGDWGKIYSWAYAGIKCGFGIRGIIVRNHRAYDNYAHGLWFDYNVKNLIVDELDARRNQGWGIFIEAMHGPTILRNSKLIRNLQGIHLANSAKVVLHHNLCLGNEQYQLHTIRRLSRPVADQDLNPDQDAPVPLAAGSTHYVPVNIVDSIWSENIFVSEFPEQYIVDTFGFRPFFDTLQSSRNLFWHPDPETAFRTELVSYNLQAWQKLTGQDLESRFEDPKLNQEFEPEPGSPLLDRMNWKQESVEDAGFHQLAGILLENAATVNTVPFTAAQDVDPSRWSPVDLSSGLNMPLSGFTEITNPLPMLQPGKQHLRGIPFVIGSVEGWGASAISLQSTQQPRSPKAELPQTVTVPIKEEHLELMYIWHVASHALGHLDIAYYSLLYADGTRHQVGMVPLGKGSNDGPTLERMEANANCQDWWPGWPQFEKETVKPVIVLEKENPTKSLRYLYILEIPNPHADKPVSGLEFKVRWPQGPATFNILAATGLKPE